MLFEGVTLEKAIEKALNELGVGKDDIDIRIVRYPSKKFFGLKSITAQVEITSKVKEPDVNEVNESYPIEIDAKEEVVKEVLDEPEIEDVTGADRACGEIDVEYSISSLYVDDKLNNEQIEAVTTTEGYIRVIAGAGSGKTRALTNRYVYLVKKLGISTSNILCVTFTNKAANEMKKRIRSQIGDYDTGLVCTFHGFCLQLLKEDIHFLNFPKNFIVLDTDDTDTILKNIYREANINSRSYTFSQAREMIKKKKNETGASYIDEIVTTDIRALKERYKNGKDDKEKIFYGYLYEQRKSYGLDFNDLIQFALRILTVNTDKCKKWQNRLEYIMVDEFQDVSSNQYTLVSILSNHHKNLFVVGDPDQTIYTWRGANVDYIVNFDKRFNDVKTIIMDINYRSSDKIIDVSNSLIKKNKKRFEKNLRATKQSDIAVLYDHSKTSVEEANKIKEKITELYNNGVEYHKMAILYRAHFVSRSLEEMLVHAKIPYVLFSGTEFYKRKEIKDILSYLRMVVFEDNLSFQRVINEPKRNFGKKRLEVIANYAEEHNCSLYEALKSNLDHSLIAKSKADDFVQMIDKYQRIYKEMKVTDLLEALLNDSGYEELLRNKGEDERLDNLSELKQSVVEFENSAGEDTSLDEYLQQVALFTNSDTAERQDQVKLMTIHTAKGLEFPYVFLCGLSEGIFPNKHANTLPKLEEERRLAYVAFTRAENALYISDSEGMNYDGSYRYPSRFIFNVETTSLEYKVKLEQKLVNDAEKYIEMNEQKILSLQQKKLDVKDRVEHKVFGMGTIQEINERDNAYLVKFDSKETVRSISMEIPMVKLCE